MTDSRMVDIDVAELTLRLIEKSRSLATGQPIGPRPPGQTAAELLDWLSDKEEGNAKMVADYAALANHAIDYFIERVEPVSVLRSSEIKGTVQ